MTTTPSWRASKPVTWKALILCVNALSLLAGCETKVQNAQLQNRTSTPAMPRVSFEEVDGLRNVYVFAWFFARIEEYDKLHGHIPFLTKPGLKTESPHGWRYEVLLNGFRQESADLRPGIISEECPWNSQVTIKKIRKWIDRKSHNEVIFSTGSQRCEILAVTGNGAAFDPFRRRSLSSLGSDTVVLVESKHKRDLWWEPQRIDLVDSLDQVIGDDQGISSFDEQGFLVAFADGTVWRLSHSIPRVLLRKFMIVDVARKLSREKLLVEWKCPVRYPEK